jgi:hypothetical protein
MTLLLRILIATISLLVLYGLYPVIWAQATHATQCPALGPLPACYVVGLCYTLIAISAIHSLSFAAHIFWIGWLPVFSLALTGSITEISGTPVCPRNALDIPLCYFSLGIATILLLCFQFLRRLETQKA